MAAAGLVGDFSPLFVFLSCSCLRGVWSVMTKAATPRFIFITGGVVSSLGKGLASAALAAVLQARGFKIRLRKLDPLS